jgi:hypothetical protein
MKYRLHIENGPHISFFCEVLAEKADGNGTMRIKLRNTAMTRFITGRMPCKVFSSGRVVQQGSIRNTREENLFIFEGGGENAG